MEATRPDFACQRAGAAMAGVVKVAGGRSSPGQFYGEPWSLATPIGCRLLKVVLTLSHNQDGFIETGQRPK